MSVLLVRGLHFEVIISIRFRPSRGVIIDITFHHDVPAAVGLCEIVCGEERRGIQNGVWMVRAVWSRDRECLCVRGGGTCGRCWRWRWRRRLNLDHPPLADVADRTIDELN